MMQHDEAFELLALTALDALDDALATAVDEHVSTCARCQHELDSMRVVANALGTTVEPLPDGLWTSIADRLNDRAGHEHGDASTTTVTSIADARRTSSSPRRVRRVLVSIVVAAAACIIALGIGLANANDHVANLENALKNAKTSVVQTALDAPGHRLVHLETSAHATVATFVVLPDGRGYLVSSTMPSLGPGLTYQLWGIVKGTPVSIGVLGRSPSGAVFTLVSAPRPTALALTVQHAGGSLVPAKVILASGTL